MGVLILLVRFLWLTPVMLDVAAATSAMSEHHVEEQADGQQPDDCGNIDFHLPHPFTRFIII